MDADLLAVFRRAREALRGGDEGLRAVRHGRRVSWQLGRRRRGSPTPAGSGIASPSRVEARAARGAWWGGEGGNSPARPVFDARALALSLIFSVPLRRVFARPAGEPTRDATARYKADVVVRRLPTSFPPFALSLQDLHWFVERPFSSPSFRPGVTPPSVGAIQCNLRACFPSFEQHLSLGPLSSPD